MRYLILINVDAKTMESGPPPAALDAAMGELMAEWSKKGVLLSAEGLQAPSTGARLRIGGKKLTVTDGPYAEAKEIVGGYFVIQAPSKAAAIEHASQFLRLHEKVLGPSFEIGCEVRPIEGA